VSSENPVSPDATSSMLKGTRCTVLCKQKKKPLFYLDWFRVF